MDGPRVDGIEHQARADAALHRNRRSVLLAGGVGCAVMGAVTAALGVVVFAVLIVILTLDRPNPNEALFPVPDGTYYVADSGTRCTFEAVDLCERTLRVWEPGATGDDLTQRLVDHYRARGYRLDPIAGTSGWGDTTCGTGTTAKGVFCITVDEPTGTMTDDYGDRVGPGKDYVDITATWVAG